MLLYSRLSFTSCTAFAVSSVTVPVLGLGIKPRGPRTLPNLRTSAIAAYFDDDMVQFFTPEDVQDLARCILLLHKDRGRLQSLRQNSDRFNQQYNWNKMGSQYVALVNGLNRR